MSMQGTMRSRGERRASDAGISLVEVMVAMGIFVIGSLSLLSVLTSTMSGTFDNRARVTAAHLAAADIDEARSLDYYALTSTVVPIEKDVDGRTYRIHRQVSVVLSSGSSVSSCVGTGTSSKQRYKKVNTRVETTFRGRVLPVRSDTMVKAPVYDPNSALGAIAFVVLDRNGAPLPNTLVNANGTTLTTDARGCVFFDGVPHGPRTVTVTRAGHVKIDGSTLLTSSVTVVAGQITSGVLRIDRTATITVGARVFGTPTPADFALPTGLSVELATPTRDGAARLVPGQPLTGSNLTFAVFPEVGGYEAYLGACFPPVATSSEPGATSLVELPLSPITVVMSTQNNSMNPGAQNRGVEVQWRGSSTCAPTLTYTVKTQTACSGPADPNSTDACRVKIAVPAGNWRFKAAGVTFYRDATVTSKTASMVNIEW